MLVSLDIVLYSKWKVRYQVSLHLRDLDFNSAQRLAEQLALFRLRRYRHCAGHARLKDGEEGKRDWRIESEVTVISSSALQ